MTVVALGGATPLASGATRSLTVLTVLLLAAVGLAVLIRVTRMPALGASACVVGLAVVGLVGGVIAQAVWISALAVLALAAGLLAGVTALVRAARGPRPQAPAWRPPSGPAWRAEPRPTDDTPGWRPEGAPPWRPKSSS